MASDGWDVLFPAKITTRGGPEANVYTEYEVTHLTCFVGGMYGLGGKLFGRDEDLETAKKLTDGCVWAYQMMPSGIMPEHAVVEACPSLDKCEFNETQWYDSLDPAKSWREEQLQMWIEAQEELRRSPKEPAKARTSPKESSREGLQKRAAVSGETKGSAPADEGSELPQSLREKLGMADAKSAAGGSAGKGAAKSSGWPDGDDDAQDTDYAGSVPTIPKQQAGRLKPSDVDDAEPPSARPQSHSEWVQQKLALEKLPRGFKAIQSPKYILRYVSGALVRQRMQRLTRARAGPRPSSRCGTCTASRATRAGWTRAGPCSRRRCGPRARRTPTAPLAACSTSSRPCSTRWRASGSPRRSSTTFCSLPSPPSSASTSGSSTPRRTPFACERAWRAGARVVLLYSGDVGLRGGRARALDYYIAATLFCTWSGTGRWR